IGRRLGEEPGNGRAAAEATAFLHDQLVRLAFDFSIQGGASEGLALVGLGGSGRGEMAPYSALDLMFLAAGSPTNVQAQPAQTMLHLLWDLKLQVGHSVRSVP